MNSIDERIVQMKFDNKQFENGIQTSVKSLDNLKKGLDLQGASKSLMDLDKAGRSFSLSGLSDSISSVSNKFSALAVIGITALANITNSAINAGRNLISSLTIDPIKMGFQEYETKMGAIQTILTNTASKGTKMKDVTAALDELNTYADKTIYNFAEMTRNIGTFTAAGVDLKTSTTSIKGIANLAAGSGSSAQQASTAMYQLSQAIAAGSVKLQDWNSVVNAGMGGELFQKALEKTAKELGKGRNMAVSFRESLQSGWITTEVLTKTLAKFAEDESLIKAATQVKTFTQLIDTMQESVQSGWGKTWEIIIGDKDEAAKLFTSINNVFDGMIGKSSDARNAMLEFWKVNGGRDMLIQAISNAFKGLQSILKPIQEAFRDIFPPTTGQKLIEITKGIRDLTSNFKIGDETANNIKRTFRGLFAVLDIGKQALLAIGNGFSILFKNIVPAGNGILSITGSIGDFLVYIDETIKKSNIFNNAMEVISKVIGKISSVIGTVISSIADVFTSFGQIDLNGITLFSDRVAVGFKPLTAMAKFIEKVFYSIVSVFQKISPFFAKLADLTGKAFNKLGNAISKAINDGGFSAVLDIVNGGIFAGILIGIKKFIGSLTSITDNAGGFLDSITGILDGVKGSLEAYQNQLKANTLIKIAGVIAILAAALFVLATIDQNKLTSSLAAMTAMFIDLFGSMAIFEKIMGSEGFKSIRKVTTAMIGLSVAVLILSVAMTKLSKLDWNGITKGIIGVASLSAILVITAKSLNGSSKGLIKSSIGLILFATAINILTNAVVKLGNIDSKTLAKGLVGVGVLVTELALFMRVTDLSKMGLLKGVGLLLLATSIVVLASAVKKLSEINASSLIKSLGAVGVILAELSIFVNTTGGAKKVTSTAIGLTILGAAMLIFGSAIEKMGSLSVNVIAKGLITMAGALTIISVALRIMPKNIIKQAIGLVVLAEALTIISRVLSTMGDMSWEQIAKGLITLAGSLTIITIAMTFMKTGIAGAAAMIIMASALAILTPCLVTLGKMSFSEIGMGLLALVGVFTVIGIAGLLLAPLTPIIIALSAAIALFGLGCMAVGVGILAFSAGITALSIAGTAGAAALTIFVTSIVNLIPFILRTLAQGLVDFILVIANSVPAISEAFVKILNGIIDTITTVAPNIIKCITTLLLSMLDALDKAVPKMVDSGMRLILGILTGISNNIRKVVEAGIDIIVKFLYGVSSKLPDIIDAAFKVIISFINGLADAIRNNSAAIGDACINLVDAIVDGIRDLRDRFIEAGKDAVIGFVKGLVSLPGKIWNAGKEIGARALAAAKHAIDSNSPSKKFAELGKFSVLGFAKGLDDYSDISSNEAKNLGLNAIDSLGNAISNISDIVSNDIDMSPTIRPVFDLSDIQNGAKQLYGIMDRYDGYNIDGSLNIANTTAKNMQHSKYGNNIDNTPNQTVSNYGGTVNNTFNITGDNPKTIAEEVSRIIQRQVERRESVWA